MLSFFRRVDVDFIGSYLNDRELLCFNELLKTEKQHSIRVAKKCLEVFKDFNICNDELEIAVKMCLLHDIGKSFSKINMFVKPIVVLISRKKLFRKVVFFINRERIVKYFNHSRYSFDMLREFDYSFEVLNSIKYHHSERCIVNNKYIRLLKYCDDIC